MQNPMSFLAIQSLKTKLVYKSKNKGSVPLIGGSTIGVVCLPPSDCAMLCNAMLWFACLLPKSLHELRNWHSIHTDRMIRTPNNRDRKFILVKFMLTIPI